MLNDYHFITHWRLHGSAEEIFDILSDPLEYPRWWPSVYLSCEETGAGDENGLGRTVRVHTRGWLPYTLWWESCAIRVERPHVLAIRAAGDFDGRGVWVLEEHGDVTDVTFDWRPRAEKPLLRDLSPVLKPVFAANHYWAMKQGRISVELELLRRRATTEGELAYIPEPPGPNRSSGYVLAGVGLAIVAGALALSRACRNESD